MNTEQQHAAHDALPRLIRVSAPTESGLPRSGNAHIRPGAAAALREDVGR
ncbi:hypothetical protein [Streptomyces sp. NPDC060035]